jgi:glycosyltransferase involved in cell wall biosynthesis
LKRRRKRAYLWLVDLLGIYREAIWHASGDNEAHDIQREFGIDVHLEVAHPISYTEADTPKRSVASAIVKAPDLLDTHDNFVRDPLHAFGGCPLHPKVAGRLDLVFLSRICRMKNLDGAIAILRDLAGTVSFDIYGPAEDVAYWSGCRTLIKSLPSNVSVHYHGPVNYERVSGILASHHLLFLPTRGENFGHVIMEALTASRPVLISDQTPWHGLEEHEAGWDISLDEMGRFRQVLQQCIDMDAERFAALCAGARDYARHHVDRSAVLQQNRNLFDYALGRAGGADR